MNMMEGTTTTTLEATNMTTRENIEMTYTIRTESTTPVAQAADFAIAMAISRMLAGTHVTVTLDSGHMRTIHECQPDHRFGQTCEKCGEQA